MQHNRFFFDNYYYLCYYIIVEVYALLSVVELFCIVRKKY